MRNKIFIGEIGMSFFEDMKTDLAEAIAMEKDTLPLVERKNMPADTFYVDDKVKSSH